MRIGFIGAGKAGCSLGKYFAEKGAQTGISVAGYSSSNEMDAAWAAAFTGSTCFRSADEVVAACDSVILSTPDGAIREVWDTIDKQLISGRIFCHLSGSLSSDVFSGIEQFGAYPISIHPMFAFSNKVSVYQQLNHVCFTLEGHQKAVSVWEQVFAALGNETRQIAKECKPKYHAAASMLSNQVIAVLETGYGLLRECGFSDNEARRFSEELVRANVEHVIQDGSMAALTGPIERGDVKTVGKHLSVIGAGNQMLYRACAGKLLALAQEKHPKREYGAMRDLLHAPEEGRRRKT